MQCLPSSESSPLGAKNFGTHLILITRKKVLEAVKEEVRLNVRLAIQDLIPALVQETRAGT
jgi:hypothetical protein